MKYQDVPISEFLHPREERFEPKDERILRLKRIEKIDFSGSIVLSEKPSNTDMIIVKKGDLVISGINVAKGALAIYDGKDDVTATIHYSSYEFDKKKINIDYLKWFLKSPAFVNLIKEQVPGGIKTEIKPKHLLPLRIRLPLLEDQIKLAEQFQNTEKEFAQLEKEIESQQSLLKKLRQQILQDAVQGKLLPQNKNDEPASELLKRIKAEKELLIAAGKLRKEKPLPPIKEEEIPFEIPKNWVWCRLGEVGDLKRGKSKHRPRNDDKLFKGGKYPFIQTGDVSAAKHTNDFVTTVHSYYNELGLAQSKMQESGTLCITIAANIAECGFLSFEACVPDSIVCFKSIDTSIDKYVCYYIRVAQEELKRFAPATAQKNINLGILTELLFPLLPLAEQQRIVAKVEQLLQQCKELEKTIGQNQKYAEQLQQAVLQEAFTHKN
ncbi:MAG: restriction endonuclease subunit S [Bacteroidota bacterium]